MSLSKPIKTTIRASDFRDGTYQFTVESLLAPDETPGIVVVSTSVGYSLTTSLTNRPRREQILRYNQQADGGWTAHAVVTLLTTEGSPTNGTVSIRAGAETVVLPIDATPLAIERSQSPVLTVDPPALTFAGTLPGKPGYQVITVAQQNSDAPVTLTTDAPDTFQFASDHQPTFASHLTVIPSPMGTYVHVRCAGGQRRTPTAQLTISSLYETKTVTLQSYRPGLLPVRLPSPPPRLMKQWGGLGALVVVGGLAYFGYGNRCELFPSLCQNITTSQPLSRGTLPATADNADVSREKTVVGRSRTRRSTAKSVELAIRRERVVDAADRLNKQPVSDAATDPKEVTMARNAVRAPQVSGETTNQTVGNAVDGRPRRATPAPSADESDLERELNQPMQNQR